MKIVHVIASIDPRDGGLQAVAMRMAAAQCASGNEVHLISYGSEEVKEQVSQIASSIPGFSSVRLHILSTPDRFERLACRRGMQLLRGVLTTGTFVHIHGVWEPFLRRAAWMASAVSIPYCISPAGMLDQWSLRQKAWKKKLALLLSYRGMLERASFIQALNADENEVIGLMALKTPRVIVPNGVFAEEFDPLPEKGTFRTGIGMTGDRRYILFLSRLHFKKGLDILAEAFRLISKSHPDVDIVVAGPPGGAEVDFEGKIRQYGLEDRVYLVGPIYGAAKLQAIIDADCFCLPSRQEGFSMAITEALACGVPVVITDACHFPEVGQEDAGVIVPLDAEAVAEGLRRVLDDKALAGRMGERGRQMVMDRFTWPAIAEMTLRNYALRA